MDAVTVLFGLFAIVVAVFICGFWSFFIGEKRKPVQAPAYPYVMSGNDPFIRDLLYPKKERSNGWKID